jgi:hypothetical protein
VRISAEAVVDDREEPASSRVPNGALAVRVSRPTPLVTDSINGRRICEPILSDYFSR